MGSWWESSFSPAKNWVARRRLRKIGNILCDYLKGIKANGKVNIDLSQMEVEDMSLQSLDEVEKIIGYRFKNRSLLSQAFTHPSYHEDCVSYERLEYVGNSVLYLLIAKEQYSTYPNLPPGLLTPLRAANIDTEKLARVAIQHNFHRYIRLHAPVLRRQIQTFIDALPRHHLHSPGLINAPKVLAGVVESTVGAVYVDSNYCIDKTWEVASDLLQPIITPEIIQKNPMMKLLEICQKYKLKVKLVDLWSQEGIYKVFVDNQLRGKGMCHEKKEIALNRAANDAYKEVVRSMSQKNIHESCSWWDSLFSPAKNWVAHQRLRKIGNILFNYQKGIKDSGKVNMDLSHVEAENKSLQSLEEVEKIIGYRFKNRSLLSQAFTHPSYHKDCVSHKRLEYVGDSVLYLLITKEQYSMYPNLRPGLLTSLRAANLGTEKLARVAMQHNFHRYIRFRTPVLRRQIQAFTDALPKHPLHSPGLINPPKVLVDVVESIVGAVFIDSNCCMDTTWEVTSNLLQPMITPEILQKKPVTKLFEICQKYKLKVKLVDLWLEEGTYKVFIDNQLRGKGMCREKKEIALNRAANDAYKEVVRSMSQKNVHESC